MTKEQIYKALLTFVVFLLAVSALGYLFFPAAMLSVVGITSNHQMDFLVRTLAAALLSLIPSAWSARHSEHSASAASAVWGIALYMFLSSVVDMYGFLTQVVNNASIPSIAFRVILGVVLLWLRPRK